MIGRKGIVYFKRYLQWTPRLHKHVPHCFIVNTLLIEVVWIRSEPLSNIIHDFAARNSDPTIRFKRSKDVKVPWRYIRSICGVCRNIVHRHFATVIMNLIMTIFKVTPAKRQMYTM